MERKMRQEHLPVSRMVGAGRLSPALDEFPGGQLGLLLFFFLFELLLFLLISLVFILLTAFVSHHVSPLLVY